jgi:hypothetical protein
MREEPIENTIEHESLRRESAYRSNLRLDRIGAEEGKPKASSER